MKTKGQIIEDLSISLKYFYDNIDKMKSDDLNRRAGVIEGYLRALGVIDDIDDIIETKTYKVFGVFPYKSKQPYWLAVFEFATEYYQSVF